MKPEWVLDKNERQSKAPKRSLAELVIFKKYFPIFSKISQNLRFIFQQVAVSTFSTSRSLEFGFTNDELLKVSLKDHPVINQSKLSLIFYSIHFSIKRVIKVNNFLFPDTHIGRLSKDEYVK